MCDKLSILRSVHHTMNDHGEGVHIAMTGYAPIRNIRSSGQQSPSIGSIVSRSLVARRLARLYRRGPRHWIRPFRRIWASPTIRSRRSATRPDRVFACATSRPADGIAAARADNRAPMLRAVRHLAPRRRYHGRDGVDGYVPPASV